MSLTPTLEAVSEMQVTDVARLSPPALMQLLYDAQTALQKAKTVKEFIEGAINVKYGQRFDALRRDQNKPYGIVHLDDAGFDIGCDRTRKTEWDQTKLAGIAKRITAEGDAVDEYIGISYSVSERKYNAWPSSIRQTFEDARILKAGKPNFTIKAVEGEAV